MNVPFGWHRFFFEARGYAAQRAQGLATRVYKPNRVHTYEDVLPAIEDLEFDVDELSKAKGVNCIDAHTRNFSLREIVPEALENDIVRNLHTLRGTDNALKEYIIEQVQVERAKSEKRKSLHVMTESKYGPEFDKLLGVLKEWQGGEKEEEGNKSQTDGWNQEEEP